MELKQTIELKNSKLLLGIIACIGILLNQSNVMLGVNLSFADFFLVSLIVIWLVNGDYELPTLPLLIFVSFSILLLIHSVFFIPYIQHFQINYRSVAIDYMKLLTIALYFLIGYQIEKKHLLHPLFFGFMFGSVFTSMIGFFLLFIPIPALSEIMYYAGVRLNGFMNDPNYFAVIQCAAFLVTLFLISNKKLLKFFILSILLFSIFFSVSKTGILTLCLSLFYCFFYFIKEGKLRLEKWLILATGLILLLALSPIILQFIQLITTQVAVQFPVFERVQGLFADFGSATLESGSGRGEVWETAFIITRSHPVLGIGIGNYAEVASHVSGDPNVAHNTYLQLSAEWGIPLTFLFSTYLFYLVFSPIRFYKENSRYIVKGVLFIFLISSLSISFNNSRLFWLMVGIASAQQSIEWLYEKEPEHD